MRRYCSTCKYPQSTCVCKWVVPQYPKVQIRVLQHYRESKNAKNTVKLACLALPDTQVFRIQNTLDIIESLRGISQDSTALLFPSADSLALQENTKIFAAKHYQTLVFIDGSWPQAKAIAKEVLNQLSVQTWQFSLATKSRYKIRHTHVEGAFSTLEAIAYALEIGFEFNSEPMLALMDQFQAYWRSPEIHHRNIR